MGSTVAPIEGSSGRKRKDLAKCLKLSKNLIRGAAFLVLMGLLLVQVTDVLRNRLVTGQNSDARYRKMEYCPGV